LVWRRFSSMLSTWLHVSRSPEAQSERGGAVLFQACAEVPRTIFPRISSWDRSIRISAEMYLNDPALRENGSVMALESTECRPVRTMAQFATRFSGQPVYSLAGSPSPGKGWDRVCCTPSEGRVLTPSESGITLKKSEEERDSVSMLQYFGLKRVRIIGFPGALMRAAFRGWGNSRRLVTVGKRSCIEEERAR
jgi:hypothetical protein